MPAISEIHLAIDCVDVDAQAEFWSACLGYPPFASAGQYRTFRPPEGTTGGIKLVLQQVPEQPSGAKNRVHIDLICGEGFLEEVERIEALGATRASEVIREFGTAWVVMRDPEGNEFCVCET
jgi:predicted enzyme related to lactoylglutathione lyase